MTSKFLLTTCALLVSLPAFAQEWTKEERAAGLKTTEFTRHIPAGKQRTLDNFGYLNPDCTPIEDTDTAITKEPDVFLCRLIIDLHSLNLVLIALVADAFFWVAGEIGCSCNLDRAVFWLFGGTDIDNATSGTVRVDCVEEADALVCFGGNDTSEHMLLQTVVAEDVAILLSEPLRCFVLGECRR
jgi:hypothetical protein